MLKEYFYHTNIGFDIRLLGALVAAEYEKIFLIQLTLYVENILLAIYRTDTGLTFASFYN